MPRGIPNAKTTDAKKPGTKPTAKATAAKPAVKPAVAKASMGDLAAAVDRITVTPTQSSPVKGNTAMSPVSSVVAEAIAKVEAANKAKPNGVRYDFNPFGYGGGANHRDAWFSHIASKKGLRQTATLYLNGEVLASTQDFTIDSERVLYFIVDDKQHQFGFVVESEAYLDMSEYTGVSLSPVDRVEVEKIIALSDKTAKALAEDELAVLLQQERPVFKAGDRVRHMANKTSTHLVVEAPQPKDPRNYRPHGFNNRREDQPDLDMIIIEVAATYNVATGESVITVVNEPQKVYSGLYMLAD